MINSKIPNTAASGRHGHTVLGQAVSGAALPIIRIAPHIYLPICITVRV